MKSFTILLSLVTLLPAVLSAVTLPEIFSDGMVLQRDTKVRIFGHAQPGERVTVSFADQNISVLADAEGRWEARLAPMIASAEPRILRVQGIASREVRDVLVGDVWLAGGQSNMGSTIREYMDTAFASEIPQANYPKFRVFTVDKRKTLAEPVKAGMWARLTPESVINISGTAYFFGRDLHRHLGVPIGIVVCAWGGTLAENWISRETLLTHAETKPIIERFDRIVAGYDAEAGYEFQLKEHGKVYGAWKLQREKGRKGVAAPKEPMGERHFQRPSGLYRTMFRTIVPYTFIGVIFYQGESNVADNRSYQYRHLLPMLVREWRRDLEADLPFLAVQLPVIKGQYEDEWAEMRESQVVGSRQVAGCEVAVVLEFGEYDKLHPPGKEGIGGRLALLARGAVYGEKVVHRGPILRSHRIEGDRVLLMFSDTGTGLVARGGRLEDFAICDASGVFVRAQAAIVGDTVEVFSSDVAKPVAVRYGWKNYFKPTLYNREGLPASGFRTDTFKLKTEEAR